MSTLTWAVAAIVTDDTGRVLLCQQGRGARRYALPGGRLRPAEGPVRAALRDIRAETGWDIELTDLVGIYQVSGPSGEAAAGRAGPLPDVLVHVFRARAAGVRPVTTHRRAVDCPGTPPTRCPRWSPRSPEPPSPTRPPAAPACSARSAACPARRPRAAAGGSPSRGQPPDNRQGRAAPGDRPGRAAARDRPGRHPGAGQPPEQRGEAPDRSLHP
ncbi:NUDIX domain-containing protein [Micromonospora sp. STR1s_5]|nr:NUDIX domain-containing protein [Micromonospora sp. STR1s_5]